MLFVLMYLDTWFYKFKMRRVIQVFSCITVINISYSYLTIQFVIYFNALFKYQYFNVSHIKVHLRYLICRLILTGKGISIFCLKKQTCSDSFLKKNADDFKCTMPRDFVIPRVYRCHHHYQKQLSITNIWYAC